jgi:hypothetical protein
MKTDRPHDEIEELIAAQALDGLDPADRDRLFREMAGHGPDCPDCARLLGEYAEVAGWLVLALEPTALSEGAEERLIAAATKERAQEAAPVRGDHRPTMPGETAGAAVRRDQRIPAPPWFRRRLAAAAVAASVAIAAGAVGWSLAPRSHGVDAQFLAFVARPGGRVVTLAAGGGRSLAVAFRPGTREAWVVGTGLPEPAGGKVYELWFRTGTSTQMQPAGTFSPKDGTILAKVGVGIRIDTLAVSVEPPGGSEQPTSTPIYIVSV